MDASMKVIVGADVTQANTALKSLDNTVTSLGTDIQNMGGKFAFTNAEVNKGSVQMDKLSTTTKAADNIVTILNKDIGELQSSLAAQNTGLSTSVTKFEESGQAAKSFGEQVKGAYSVLRQAAFILPGIGVSGIISLAFTAVASAVEQFSAAANNAAAAQKVLNEALGAGSASAQGEISKLTDLASIAFDVSNSTETRKTAFSELQELYPGYLGNLDLEKSKYSDIQTAINNVTGALIRQSQIKGLQGAIEDQFKDINKEVADGGTTFNKVLGTLVGIGEAAKNIFGGDPAKAFKQVSSAVTDLGTAADQSKAADRIAILNKALQDLLKTSIIDGDAKLNPPKVENKPVIDALQVEIAARTELARLQKDASKEDTEPIFKKLADSLNENSSALLSDKIALLIRENTKNGIKKSITDEEVKLMQEQLAKLTNPNLTSNAAANLLIPIKPEYKLEEQTLAKSDPQLTELFADLGDKLPKLVPMKIHIEPQLLIDGKILERNLENLKNTIANSVINIGEGVLEDIGKAFAGVKDPFGNVLQLLGDGLESIGKQLIVVGGLAQTIQEALGTLFINPTNAIIVGALAIAAGAAVKAIGSKKGVALAEGGIVTGPTNALIGEGGQPEVVFPLDKLNSFLKGTNNSQNINVGGALVVKGTDLVTVLNRTNKNQGYAS